MLRLQGRRLRASRTSPPAPSSRCSPTTTALDAAAVDRVLLCSGKVYYDLEAERAKREDTETAIVRVEQLYPLPVEEIARRARRLPASAELVWVQEEPANQGAWPFMALNLPRASGRAAEAAAWRVVARPASASPATGSTQEARGRAGGPDRPGVRPLRRPAPATGRAPGAPVPAPSCVTARPGGRMTRDTGARDSLAVYFTDRGIEELVERRGDEEVTLEWLAERLRDVRRPQPGVRDPDRAVRHLAGPARRRRGLRPA